MSWLDNFPYTNFHEINTDWLLKTIQELIRDWEDYKEEMDLKFEDLKDETEAFTAYVTNYLTNLDVQEEINNKLDQMDESGALDAIVAPIIAAWLAEHITPTTPVVDNTLSISGAAADSKTVGDMASLDRGLITDGVNINTLRQPGFYRTDETHSLDTTNTPEDVAGHVNRIIVFCSNNSYSACLQVIYDCNTGKTYYRSIRSGSYNWRAWQCLNMANTIVYSYGGDSDVPAGSDLNDLITQGIYYIAPNNAGSMLNMPFANRARLLVMGYPSHGYSIVQLLADTTNNIIYHRTKGATASTWNEWKIFSDNEEAFTFRAAITTQTDANNIADPGYYYINASLNTLNAPTGEQNNSAKLLVFNKADSTVGLVQVWISTSAASNKIFYRVKVNANTNWTDWIELLNAAIYDDEQANRMLTFRQQITAGQDFDDLTTAGYYYKQGSLNTMHGVNDTQAKIVVYNRNGSGQAIVQVWYDVNKNVEYFRTKKTTTTPWEPWQKVLTKNYNPTPGHAECLNAFNTRANELCAEMGMNNTTVTSPNGNISTTSTARDMYKLLIAATSENTLAHIWNTKNRDIVVRGNNARTESITTTLTSPLIENEYNILGGKPGLIGATVDPEIGLVANLIMVAEPKTNVSADHIPLGFAGVVFKSTSADNRFNAMDSLLSNIKAVIAGQTPTAISTCDYAIGGVIPAYNTANIDNATPQTLYEQDPDIVFPTASTIKLLTNYMASRMLTVEELEQWYTFDSSDITSGSGNIFSAGDSIKIKDLMYCSMMISSNTATVGLAHYLGDKILSYNVKR